MTNRSRTFFSSWLPLVLYLILIFVLSSLSHPPLISSLRISDKVLHGFEYALLSILVFRALGSLAWLKSRVWRTLGFTLLVVCLLGAADELLQRTTPGRMSDLHDWLADGIGGAVGGAIWTLRLRLGKRSLLIPPGSEP